MNTIGRDPETNKDTALSWYAMKVFYNRVFVIEDRLKSEGVESYVPCTTVQKIVAGKKKTLRKPLVSGLLFFRTTESFCRKFSQLFWGQFMIYSRTDTEFWTPAPIPEKQFNIFRLVTSAGEQGLEYFDDDRKSFSKGQRVRVIEGPFKGAEGKIIRIKGDRRLVVAVEGVCAVATSYIPQCFLEKLED